MGSNEINSIGNNVYFQTDKQSSIFDRKVNIMI